MQAKRRFPKVAADGSFVVCVVFSSAPGVPINEVQQWLSAWATDHSEWQAFGRSHAFADYFTTSPEVQFGADGELRMVVRGRDDAKRFWKDWYVRICSELLTRFPEAGKVIRVENY